MFNRETILILITLSLLAWPGCRRPREDGDGGVPGRETAAAASTEASPSEPVDDEEVDYEDERPAGKGRPRRFSAQEMLGGLGYVDTAEDEDPEDAGQSGVVLYDEQRSSPGYTLYTSIPMRTARLIDVRGTVIKEWSAPDSKRWFSAELEPDGKLLVVGLEERDKSEVAYTPHDYGYVMRMTWDGGVIWKKTLALHHDADVTPDGHIISPDDRVRVVEEFDLDIRDNNVIRLTADGEKVDERSMYDVFSSAPDIISVSMPSKKTKTAENDRIDLFHTNSVEWMDDPALAARHEIYGLENVLVSCRLQDTIAIFNWTTGKALWAWGRGEIEGQHDATVLPSGNILLFDNGMNRRWSRVIELDPLTKRIVWEYKGDPPADFYSASRGTSQLLPNGNVLVALSNSGAGVEITRDGQIVWRFLNPDHEDGKRAVLRMRRYDVDFVKAILSRHGDDGR